MKKNKSFLNAVGFEHRACIDVEEVERLLTRLREINEIPFRQIDWIKECKTISLDEEAISAWEKLGLNNTDFIMSNYVLKKKAKKQRRRIR